MANPRQTMTGAFLIREVAESLGEPDDNARPMVEVLTQLRDEISVLSVKGHGFGDRNLSMMLTRLDEAKHWATEYGLAHGALLLVDKRKYMRQLDETKDLTVTTLETESGVVDARV